MRLVISSLLMMLFAMQILTAQPASARQVKDLAINQKLSHPLKLAFDNDGNLIFADAGNNRICKIDKGTGVMTVIAGVGTPGLSGDGGPALDAQLFSPSGVAVTKKGDMYIADTYNCRVRKVDHETGNIVSIPIDLGNVKDSVEKYFIMFPISFSIIDDDLFIHGMHPLVKTNLQTQKISIIENVIGDRMAMDNTGRIAFWASQSVIKMFDPATVLFDPKEKAEVLRTYADSKLVVDGSYSKENNTIEKIGSRVLLNDIKSMAFHPSGNLYFLSSETLGSIYKISFPDQKMELVTNSKMTALLNLKDDACMIFDKEGACYISDSRSNIIRKINFETQAVTIYAGINSEGLSFKDYAKWKSEQLDNVVYQKIALTKRSDSITQTVAPKVFQKINGEYHGNDSLSSIFKKINDTTYIILFWEGSKVANQQLRILEKVEYGLGNGQYKFILFNSLLGIGSQEQSTIAAKNFLSFRKNAFDFYSFDGRFEKNFIDGQDISVLPVTMVYKNGRVHFYAVGSNVREDEFIEKIKKWQTHSH